MLEINTCHLSAVTCICPWIPTYLLPSLAHPTHMQSVGKGDRNLLPVYLHLPQPCPLSVRMLLETQCQNYSLFVPTSVMTCIV